jgi:hypothetical protein
VSDDNFDLFDPTSRADQIFKRFCEFHVANPRVWELFVRFTRELVDRGFEHYSVDAVIQRIRWHVNIETKGEEVKINDHYRAYYARMFIAKYPQFDGFFELRKRLSADKPAYEEDIAVFRSGPVSDERTLMEQLRRMP